MNHRTRIKFCGMTRSEDIAQAVSLGVDAIGLIFVPGSPRQLSIDAGAGLRAAVPPLVTPVALLRNPEADLVRTVVAAVRPLLLQFHGEEPADFCASFGLPYLKAIAMGDGRDSWQQRGAAFGGAAALLLDGHVPGGMGGQGRSFDWSVLRPRAGSTGRPPILLAGGLGPANVAEAILAARPFGVDVSSGIEAEPGRKDSGKMRDFVRGVRCADADIPD